MSFKLVSQTPIDSLNINVQHFVHEETGAVHYHLACDHDEKAFLVALRTMPMDSTGVAHILEHSALCGSEKYPVRDPFFMMTRRSLNTFMNAMTSSDWTAYPFASQNDKDFNNLLDVYLDAVFFSRLDELDFAQEGHRVEFAEKGNPNSKLEYKGVVFNEMKGAMSSPISQLWQGISSYLFPTTTYHYNSGGEPAAITDLTYEQLLNFYRSHYHPSNAIFMTFGNLDAQELQAKLEQQALARFQQQDKTWTVPLEKRYNAPLAIEQSYALETEDSAQATHHVVGWLLGESIDLDAQLEAHLLSSVLLDNSASPLRQALEQTDLASAPSPLCGLEDSNREMSFICGVEGSEPEHAQAIEQLILDTLQQVAEQGVPTSMVEAALHQLELHQREIGGDHYPYGLQLMLNALGAAIHYGDPVGLLNLEPALQRLREKALQPHFIQDAITRLLLNNRHRVRLTLKPDAHAAQEAKRLEEQQLADLAEQLSEQEKQQIIQRTAALEARQNEVDDAGLLPQVTLADVRPESSYLAPYARHNEGLPYSEYQVGTNGLVYQQLLADVPKLTEAQLAWLPFFTQAWTEIGAGSHSYLEQQQRQTATLGSLSAYASIKAKVDDCNQLTGTLVMSGKALTSKVADFSALVHETWLSANFNESERLLDLLKQLKSRREHGMTGNGHGLAMALAAAPLNHAAAMNNQLAGLAHVQQLKRWVNQAQTQGAGFISEALQALYATITPPTEALLIHDAQGAVAHTQALKQLWSSGTPAQSHDIARLSGSADQWWMIDSQVNFCAWALPTVTMEHPDAPALSILAGILRNGYLHTAIREKGGAYGAGAVQDAALGCFKFYSYRDPRTEGTFQDFAASIQWFLAHQTSPELIEQSVLGIIGNSDRPGSPAGEAKQFFHLDRSGRTLALRQQFRARLLACTWQDLQEVAERYLLNQNGSRAVIAPRNTSKQAESLGLIANDY